MASAEDIDKAISQGLGLRYSFMGPFEVMHLNAQGIKEYCELYGENIVHVCETQSPTHPLSGPTLDNITGINEVNFLREKLTNISIHISRQF